MELQEKLQQSLQEKLQRLTELKAQDPFVDPEHANDNAANDLEAREEEGHDRIQAQIEELTQEQEAIQKALNKIKEGTYGICEKTGKPIPVERLKVFPAAATIVLPDQTTS